MNRLIVCALLAGIGCGDDTHPMNQPDAPPAVDAGIDALDHGQPSTTYPAFSPDMPTLQNLGGSVIANMHIVTVTWSTDTNAATFEAMADSLGASNYWMALTSEYGVGATTSAAADHIHITTTAPTMMTDTDLKNLVTTNVGNGSWPAPTASTAYLVYTLPSTTITFQGQNACASIGGYHDQATVGGVNFPFAFVFGCTASTNVGGETATGTYALESMATDPHPFTSPAYMGFDHDHLAWGVLTFFNDELSSACEVFPDSFYTDAETGFMYFVARGWSNASAHAGHNPCVPAASGAYFNVTPFPAEQDTISSTLLGNTTPPTKGYKGVVGQPRTFTVGFYSDAATTGPITLSASLPTNLPSGGPNGTAMVSVDKTTGLNGEKAFVTVTPMTFNANGVIYVQLKSSIGSINHLMPILIGQ